MFVLIHKYKLIDFDFIELRFAPVLRLPRPQGLPAADRLPIILQSIHLIPAYRKAGPCPFSELIYLIPLPPSPEREGDKEKILKEISPSPEGEGFRGR
jgi:hypothetical protein